LGDGVVPDYLKKNSDLEIVTCDIDEELEPDIVANITDLPYEKNQFDLVVAFEVLEHLPFEKFELVLKKLKEISNDKVILSLPYRNTAFEVILKFPFVRTLTKRNYLRLLLPVPLKFPGIEFSTQHYWEMGRGDFKIKKIRKIIKKYFDIKKEDRALLHPYQHFFVLYNKQFK
jgi:polyphosphate kinase